jgi:Anti-sigma-K factor rskA/Putative zinc-finger
MGPHEEFLELCTAATAGELSAEEQTKLQAHLSECPECRRAMKDYESIATKGIPQFSAELADARDGSDDSWSVSDAEKRFLKRLDRERPASVEAEPHKKLPTSTGQRYTYRPSQIRWKEVWMPFAAAVLLAVALGVSLYKTGLRRGVESAHVSSAPSKAPEAQPGAQPVDGSRDHGQLEAKLAEKDKTIDELKRQLADQRKAVLTLENTNSPSTKTADATRPGTPDIARTTSGELAAAQAKLAGLQKALDAATMERSEISNRAAALEARLAEVSGLDKQREHSIDEKDARIANLEELLEHDRDIRELMSSRDLYIADVYDVSGKGTSKTYGRVFCTKGKRLIFHAFDLDKEPGVQNASTFQAWGRKGPDKQQARSLGIFYEDDVNKKHWILKADDPKALEDIDAVFVTVEPHGGSQHPSGKQLLFAYLRVNANHP